MDLNNVDEFGLQIEQRVVLAMAALQAGGSRGLQLCGSIAVNDLSAVGAGTPRWLDNQVVLVAMAHEHMAIATEQNIVMRLTWKQEVIAGFDLIFGLFILLQVLFVKGILLIMYVMLVAYKGNVFLVMFQNHVAGVLNSPSLTQVVDGQNQEGKEGKSFVRQVRSCLEPEEKLTAMEWVLFDAVALLAVGTSFGALLLFSQKGTLLIKQVCKKLHLSICDSKVGFKVFI